MVTSGSPSIRSPFQHPPNRESTACYLAAGLLAPLVFVPFVFAAGVVTPRYGHVSSTFSDSAAQGAPHPEVIGAGLILLAFCLVLFSVGLSRVIPRGRRITRLFLLTTAISIGGTVVFQDYSRSSLMERNTEGYLHNAFALIAVFSILATIASTGIAIRGNRQWAPLLPVATMVFTIAALSGLAFNFGPDSHDGLAERVLAFSAFLWISVLSGTGISTLYGLSSHRPQLRPARRAASIEPLHVSSDD